MNLLFSLHPAYSSFEFLVSSFQQVVVIPLPIETGNRKLETALPDCHSRPAHEAREELNT